MRAKSLLILIFILLAFASFLFSCSANRDYADSSDTPPSDDDTGDDDDDANDDGDDDDDDVFIPRKRALLIVPHPDDEILGFTSVFLNYDSVRVVLVTCGDWYHDAIYAWANCTAPPGYLSPEEIQELDVFRPEFCGARIQESTQALGFYDIEAPEVLMYPDGQLWDIWENGHAVNYQGQEFIKENLVNDLIEVIEDYKPDTIFTTDELDTHPDHTALFYLVEEAMRMTGKCDLITSIIHSCDGVNNWPLPPCRSYSLLPCSVLRLERQLVGNPLLAPIDWLDIEYYKEPLTELDVFQKLEAISAFKTQTGEICRDSGIPPPGDIGCLDRCGYMLAFARTNEIFRSWDLSY